MDFRTTIRMGENQGLLHHSDSFVLMGSCFSDNIGARLHGAMMQADVNPFGTLFNPLSIAWSVNRLIASDRVAGATLFMQNGVWNSFDFHSRFSHPDKDAALRMMNTRIEAGHRHLRDCQVLVVTLGTAMAYRHKATGMVVANCHKVPQNEFDQGMASVAEMSQALGDMVEHVRDYNPHVRIIFTVSPIRHIADGLDVNSLSKARLRVAIDEVMASHPGCTIYFPAYEIMNDDLRDYRFYSADMVHPSDVAIEYIWQAFQATYFDDRSAQAIARCERVYKRLQHRPMSSNREVVERFKADTQAVLSKLQKEYPYITLPS